MRNSIHARLIMAAALVAGSGAGCASQYSFEALTASNDPQLETGIPDESASGGTTSGGSSSGGAGAGSTTSSAGASGASSSSGGAGAGASGASSSSAGGGGNGNGNGNGAGGAGAAGAGDCGAGAGRAGGAGGELVQCVLDGPHTKIGSDSERVLGRRGNGSKSRICMSARACLTTINAYAVARGCTLATGSPTTPGATGQCTQRFPGSKGTCHHAAVLSDEQVGNLLESMAN